MSLSIVYWAKLYRCEFDYEYGQRFRSVQAASGSSSTWAFTTARGNVITVHRGNFHRRERSLAQGDVCPGGVCLPIFGLILIVREQQFHRHLDSSGRGGSLSHGGRMSLIGRWAV